MADTTTIEVSTETWQRLSGRKRPGDSFDDVVERLLDETREPTEEHGAAEPAEIDEVLSDWYPGRTDEDHAERRASARAVLRYLREHGSATRAEFVDEVYADHGVKGQSEDTWWKKTARGQLDDGTGGALAIAKSDGLVTWERGPPHIYHWVGD